jgi:hypothetical protein
MSPGTAFTILADYSMTLRHASIPVAILRLQWIFGKVLLSKQDQEKALNSPPPRVQSASGGCQWFWGVKEKRFRRDSCREFEGAPQLLCSSPKNGDHRGLNWDNAMTVQQNAAGGLGVSPNSFNLPPRLGAGG